MANTSVLASASRIRAADFVALMKPRVMALAVFTAFVAFLIAPGALDPLRATLAILAIACGAVVALAIVANAQAAGLLAFTILFYVVVYTAWLKRRTPQNIVIGGAVGALPPVVGCATATGDIGLAPIVLFLIIFLRTPSHLWGLSLNRRDDYVRAGVPMLPVVAGHAATVRQILLYSFLLVPASLLPCALGFAGALYGVTAWLSSTAFLLLAFRLRISDEADRRAAHGLFIFSIAYLFLLFAALLLDHGGRLAGV
jgi:protoheme IX farnesyltransferase